MENWKPDYYLTRYTMDCAKKWDYNGIKYNSAKSRSAFDIVLFYPEKLKIEAIGDPGIEIFLDKDNKEIFSPLDLDF